MLHILCSFLFKMPFVSFLVNVLFTFYIQDVLKLKNKFGSLRINSQLINALKFFYHLNTYSITLWRKLVVLGKKLTFVLLGSVLGLSRM